jgi:hypothetical protein
MAHLFDRKTVTRGCVAAAIAVVLGFGIHLMYRPVDRTFAAAIDPTAQPAETAADVAALRAEVDRLKGIVPDQSHVMSDVAMHWGNLWFAARAGNWPLAQFCFDETRSHILWAIRVIPVRKNLKGEEIRLAEIFAPIDGTNLKAVGQTIHDKDPKAFETAYRHMLDSCYACHLAADKPYLRLHVPEHPPTPVLDFEEGKR